jgi:peptide/nickel transport system permease protein
MPSLIPASAEADGLDPLAPLAAVAGPSLQRRGFWLRVLRNPGGAVGALIVLVLLLAAATADWVAPYAPAKMGAGKRLQPPSAAHLFGTDEFGRDMLSRILHGARLTLEVGAIAVGISLVIGVAVGLLAAYRRGWVEALLMRSVDVVFSFTETLIALACVAVLGPSLENAMIAVGIAGIPFYARTCFAAAIVERSKPYFDGAVASGLGPFGLTVLHLLPNVMPTMVVVATLGVSNALLAAAGLSFLGLGAQPPAPEWGAMLSGGRDFFNRAPWLMVVPGLAIAVTVFGFNLLGEAVREALDMRPVQR